MELSTMGLMLFVFFVYFVWMLIDQLFSKESKLVFETRAKGGQNVKFR